ncbi:GH39 family glycosyl hydrolase [Natronospora cellulosivora (SeqCode)]
MFEEQGVPYTPFHGGFGLVANGLIPKPTFWTFKFFKELQGKCVFKNEEMVVVQKQDGGYCGVAWNLNYENSDETLQIKCEFPTENKEYSLIKKTVDESCCNPLKVWHDLGEPSNPVETQLELLRDSAKPLISTDRLKSINGSLSISIELKRNAVLYFELCEAEILSDRGYDYHKVMSLLKINDE